MRLTITLHNKKITPEEFNSIIHFTSVYPEGKRETSENGQRAERYRQGSKQVKVSSALYSGHVPIRKEGLLHCTS